MGKCLMTEFNIEDYDILKYNKNKYQEYSHHELALFAQEAQKTFFDIRSIIFDNRFAIKSNKEILAQIKEIIEKANESDVILDHWETLHKHFEENPTLKEEWDALCMGIKLTEDCDG